MISVATIVGAVAAAAQISERLVYVPWAGPDGAVEAQARACWLALRLSGVDSAGIGRQLGEPTAVVLRQAMLVDIRMAAERSYAESLYALERAVIAAAQAAERHDAAVPADRDALAIARLALSSRRAATDLAVEEIEVLARAVVAGAAVEPAPLTLTMEAADGQD